jgi:hypothetical protein
MLRSLLTCNKSRRMNTFRKSVCILLFSIPFLAISQTKLTSLSTTRYLTQAYPSIKKLTIYGENLWPDYMTNAMSIELVVVHFKKDGRDQVIQKTSGTKTQLTVSFSSADWLTTPGNIEVYLMMGGPGETTATRRTNSLWITVDAMPTFPPVITDVSPKEFRTGLNRDQYYITILGNHFGEEGSTSVTIGGITANYGRLDLDNGKMYYWIPKELIATPGNYDVIVRTAFGESRSFPISIVSPTMRMVPVAAPIKVGPKVNTPVSTNKMIVANTKAITTTEAVLLSGARVTLRGNISSEADKTLLENYINRLDHVVVVTNQLALSDNNANLLITITGRNVDGSALENIRTSINAKLKELKIEPAGVLIENK